MLSEGGHPEAAYALITQTAFPSWLYPVTQGATTIWEHWDSYTEHNGFGGRNAMNSFNHYSLGSVVSWFYEYVLGIQRDVQHPGYGHFMLKPDLKGFSNAEGGFNSPYGRIEASYFLENGTGYYTCSIPENSSATVILPGIKKEVGSGEYKFTFDI